MSYYQCQRCFFKTKQRTGILRHLERKNKCVKTFSSYKYNDEQLYHMSLIMRKKNNNKLLLKDNKKGFDEENINNQCKYCLKCFSNKGNLNKHLRKHDEGDIPIYPIDFYQEQIDDEKNNNQKEPNNFIHHQTSNTYSYQTFSTETTHVQQPIINEEINDFSQNETFVQTDETHTNNQPPIQQNINQTIQNITVNQQFNNFQLFNMKYPNGFDKEWDLSKISDEKKLFLINCCNTKYSELLKFILQNEDNLNVILENENDTGIVYKNDTEKYIHLNKSDIIDQSLVKLNNQLNELCREICLKNQEDPQNIEKYKYETLKINKKLSDYKTNNHNIKDGVQNLITNIFNEKKDKSIDLMNKIIEEETKNNLLKNNGF